MESLDGARLTTTGWGEWSQPDSHISLNGTLGEEVPEDRRVGYPHVAPVPIGPTLFLAGVALVGHWTPAADGPRPHGAFTVAGPTRTIVFVESVPMAAGGRCDLNPYLRRVESWLVEQGISVIPVDGPEAAGP